MCALKNKEFQFGRCYCRLHEDELVLGNELIERVWKIEAGALFNFSFKDKGTGKNWFASRASNPSPTPCFFHFDAKAASTIEFTTGKRFVTEEPSLQVLLSTKSEHHELSYEFQIFDHCSAVVCRMHHTGNTTIKTMGDPSRPDQASPTGIETVEGDNEQLPSKDALEIFNFNPLHLRLTQVELVDQTDVHNNLVFEKDWLLHTCEKEIKLKGNLFYLEDVLSKSGLIFLKLAPLPHARPVKGDRDLLLKGNQCGFYGHGMDETSRSGYQYSLISYTDGNFGRIQALQNFQRQFRSYVPERDVMFLTNTWGDRSKDGRITEPFMQAEIEAGERIGVDVIQVDDGWQEGRTANSVESGGVWIGFWAANANFWNFHSRRLPNGIEPLLRNARTRGIKMGLWFAPDSADDFANWRKDADTLLALYKNYGISYFKIDGVKAHTKSGEQNLRRFFDTALSESNGNIVFDLDVTAEIRPGYFGMLHTGPIFVENRYTDWHRYWPHQTLRNLWMLAHYVDPRRLRMEFLNHTRNSQQYIDDALAPMRYRPAYLFATIMFSNPLGWFEITNLPESYIQEVRELVDAWKLHRREIFSGSIYPIGDEPDGTSWTGFMSAGAGQDSAYLLVFRELNPNRSWQFDLPKFLDCNAFKILHGSAHMELNAGRLLITLDQPLSFAFVKLHKS